MFLTSLFTTIGNAIKARNAYHNTVYELNRLTDRDLSDLGISRSDIHRVAAESAFKRLDNSEKKISGDRFQRTLIAKEA